MATKELKKACQAPMSVCKAQESCAKCISINKDKAIERLSILGRS